MKSIYDILVDWHNTDPEFIFLEYKKSYTLNDIIHEVESLSKSLSYIPSNHIGIHISSKLDFILLYLACIKINKVPIVLKTTWGIEEINSIVDNHKINHIICCWNDKSIFNKSINTYFFEELINSSRGCGIPSFNSELLDYESVIYTSGSTGFPKGVCLKKSNFFNSSISWNEQINFNSNDRYAICLPMHHISGLAILYRSIHFKFGLSLMDNYREIHSSNISLVSLVPSILDKLINQDSYQDTLKSLRGIIIGGEPASKNLIDKCIDLKLNLFISYGMTETCSGISGFWVNDNKDKYSSVGKPFSNVDISIDNLGKALINSKMNMLGYYYGEKNENPLVSPDIGEINDNFLYLNGRCDDIVTIKGEKINLYYIQRALMKHHAINSAEVKIENNKYSDDIISATITSKDHNLSEQMIKDWCKKRIGKYKTPQKIILSNM